MDDWTNPLMLRVSVQRMHGEHVASYVVPLPGCLPVDDLASDRLVAALKEVGAFAYVRLANEALWKPDGWQRVEERA